MNRSVVALAVTATISLTGLAAASPGEYIVDPNLPGTTHYDGWLAVEYEGNSLSSLSGSVAGFTGRQYGTATWPSGIAAYQGDDGHDAEVIKLSSGLGGPLDGGPYPGSDSLYFGGYSPEHNRFGGTVAVHEPTALANVANIVLQIEIGEAYGYDFWEGEDSYLPTLNYNGESQAIEATSWELAKQVYNGTFPAPEGGGEQPLYINTYLFQWDLSDVTDPIDDFQIVISAVQHARIHAMRLDQSDTFAPIPEPASLGLLGTAGLLLLRRRRRA